MSCHFVVKHLMLKLLANIFSYVFICCFCSIGTPSLVSLIFGFGMFRNPKKEMLWKIWDAFANTRHNEAVIAALNAEKQSSEFRARTTRLAKWSELVKLANEALEVTAGVPERIQTIGLQLAT